MSVDSLKTMMGIVFQNLQAVQSNLANVDTPGYKRQEVDFQTVFMELQHHGELLQPSNNYRHSE